MHLTALDWSILAGYALFALTAGFLLARRAGRDADEFFLAGRTLPWWVAGTSMVATTFACDTPLVVSGWVREQGIWMNWQWWCLALCNLLAVVLFARYWRRGHVMTTAELAELRYGGASAGLLRGVLGVFQSGITNVIILCWVLLAATKILDVLFAFDKTTSLAIACAIALLYSVLAGFWAVVVTDVVQFAMAVTGAIVLAVLGWEAVGGTAGVMEAVAAGAVPAERLHLLPSPGPGGWLDASWWTVPIASLAVFLGVQWWAYEYVDGGVLAVQRISASRSERDGVLATLWYCVAHYALRPWPWITVGIASLVLLPAIEVTAPFDGRVQSIDATRGSERIVLVATEPTSAVVEPVPGQPDASTRTERYETATLDLRALEPLGVFPAREDDAEGAETQRPSGWYPTQFMQDGSAVALDAVAVGTPVRAGDVIARTDPERAYVVMLAGLLPAGLLGLAVAALLAAFMSTIDTHVNLASSFFVNDVYRRFLRRDADPHHYVTVGRVASVAVLAFAAFLVTLADSISDLFTFFLAFLSGVGPVYVLRWLWWRVKASTEIVAMLASSATATLLKFPDRLHSLTGADFFARVEAFEWTVTGLSEGGTLTAPGVVVVTVFTSLTLALLSLALTPRPRPERLVEFYRRVRPAGAWGPVRALCPDVTPPREAKPVLLGWLGGLMTVFGFLLGTGWWILGEPGQALAAVVVAFVGTHLVSWALRALPAWEDRAPEPALAGGDRLPPEVLQAPDVPRYGDADASEDESW